MNIFSDISKQRLKTCHRDLQTLFAHVVQEIDCTIICGHRDKEDQDKAFAENKSQLKYPNSKHNRTPSAAVDAAPYIQGKINWTRDQAIYFVGYVKAIADRLYITGVIHHRIRLGADFNENGIIGDDKFFDAPHFELIANQGEVL
jgi:peptidoglycan L-alanyl-D-glutamate endopeptidase CwlK